MNSANNSKELASKSSDFPPETSQNIEKKINGSLDVSNETCQFRKLIYTWLANCRADNLSDRTINDYRDKVFKFRWWYFEYSKLASTIGEHPKNIKPQHMKEYAIYLRTPQPRRWNVKIPEKKQELSQASIESYARAVKVFFNFLEREEYIVKTPFNKSVKFTNRNKKDKSIKTLNAEQVKAIFAALTNESRLELFNAVRDLAIVALLLDSGIRIGELLSMRMIDLDMKNNRVKVSGKTGIREAVFSERCRGFLLTYSKHSKNPYNNGKKEKLDNSPFWVTSFGTSLSSSAVETMFDRLNKICGVEFSPHDLRHTFATNMAQQGVNSHDLMRLLGHSQISTTMIYVNQSIEHLSQVHKANSPLNNISFGEHLKGRGRPRKQN